MFNIRPHHLRCMRAYSGSGYSEEFKEKIETVIKEIKVFNEFLQINNENEIKKVNIVFSTDDLCLSCPNMIGKNKCISQEKVSLLDSKVVEYFSIEEGVYDYKQLEQKVYNKINEEIFDNICKTCEWYNKTNCKKYIIKE